MAGLNGIGGSELDASTRARDMANMAGRDDMDMSMGFGETPQSLGDVDTAGMGEGLSAMREGLGEEGSGMELHAGLADEEPDNEIHAALEDEEEEEEIHAGRQDPSPVNAGYGETSQAAHTAPASGKVELGVKEDASSRSSFDGGYGGRDLSSDPNQSIDDIFIAGSFNRGGSSSGGSSVSSTGGTMYDPSKDEKVKVSVGFQMPGWLKTIIWLVVILAAAYVVLTYVFHVKVQNYFHPVDVQQYEAMAPEDVEKALGVKFKDDNLKFESDQYSYQWDIKKAGGLRLVDVSGVREFIEVTGLRIDYSIYGIRPQLDNITEANNKLTAAGFTKVSEYDETEELGSQGHETVYMKQGTGEGVILGTLTNYKEIKAIKYVPNCKKFLSARAALRGSAQ